MFGGFFRGSSNEVPTAVRLTGGAAAEPPLATATAVPFSASETPGGGASSTISSSSSSSAPASGSLSPILEDAAATSSEVPTVAVRATTQSVAYGASDAASVLVGINLTAKAAPEADSDRAAVDVVVVSDVSGSMRGDKMTLLKDTGKMLLNEFVAKDRVGLVTFDSTVREPLRLTHMSPPNKTRATAQISGFNAGTQTNLSGGLFAGVQQLLDSQATKGADGDSNVKTVMLMTDGEANQGLSTAEQIVPVLGNMLEGSGISLHTFGYGSNHNSDLLRAIATAGSGSYYYVEGVDDIRSAFGDCLGGVLSVVAQNLELTIEAVNGATITKVHHKSAKAVEPGRIYTVRFADVYGEEQRDVLADVRLPAGRAAVKDLTSPEARVLRCSLRYVDVLAAKPAASGAAFASVLRPEGSLSAAERAARYGPDDPHLELQALRIAVADCLEQARARADGGDLAGGRALVTAMQRHVANAGARLRAAKQAARAGREDEEKKEEPAGGGSGGGAEPPAQGPSRVSFFGMAFGSAPAAAAAETEGGGADGGVLDEAEMLLPSFAEDLAECLEGMVDREVYRSITSKKMAYLSEGHFQQRCMDSVSSRSMAADGSVNVSLRSNAYRTKAKASKASKFSMGF